MDVEKTIQSIAESQLRAERRADRADARMDKFDKQLRATAALVKEGVKMVRGLRDSQKETDYKLNALIDSQIRTEEQVRKHEQWLRKHDEAMRKSDEKFNRLLEALRRKNGNGHN